MDDLISRQAVLDELRKAENMRAFILDENTDLTVLSNDKMLKPIKLLKNKIVEMSDIHETNN